MQKTPFPIVLLQLLVVLASLYFDARRRSIPNWLTWSVLPLAPVLWAGSRLHAASAFGVPGPLLYAGLSIAGASACAAVPLLLFRFSLIGGGDVKLFACLGALALPAPGLLIEWVSFILAALFLPARMAYQGRLISTALAATGWAVRPFVSVFVPGGTRRPMPEAMSERVRLTPFVLLACVAVSFLGATS